MNELAGTRTMNEMLRVLFSVLGKGSRRDFAFLVILMTVSATFETLSVASIMPFISLLNVRDLAAAGPIVAKFTAYVGQTDLLTLQILSGGLTFLLICLSNGFALLTTWVTLRVTYGHAHELSSKLLAVYLAQPYRFFLQENTSKLSKNILNEVQRVTLSVIIPAFQAIAKLLVVVLLVLVLLSVDAKLALFSATGILTAYAAIYVCVRRRLRRYGRSAILNDTERFKVTSEALGGAREVILSQSADFFLGRFVAASRALTRSNTIAETMKVTPKYLVEIVAFGGVVLIALYLLVSPERSHNALPVLALYAFAGYRLIPAVQQIYSSFTLVRYHLPALETVVKGLLLMPSEPPTTAAGPPLALKKSFVIDNVSYQYPEADRTAVTDVSMHIKRGTTVGIVGRSGAGKTTLVDVVLGLLLPTKGKLEIDGVALDASTQGAWRRTIGYAPQQIFLLDDTVTANIAFGIEPAQVDRSALESAAKSADLHDFILSLPQGYDTLVGERGIRFSGGQRQRLALARALYRRPSLLVLDEATSALDNVTESAVMGAVHGLSGKITLLIVAHRLSTVRACDVIHVMDKGCLVASGSYDQLLAHSALFRDLATDPRSIENGVLADGALA